jgi:hypothetical protein
MKGQLGLLVVLEADRRVRAIMVNDTAFFFQSKLVTL